MSKRILIVEDSEHKRERILSLLQEIFIIPSIDQALSFTSACASVTSKQYDLVIMDMSLPTYDRSRSDSGGALRTFGGREVARKMIRRGLGAKIVFVTQYDSFSDVGRSHTLPTLGKELELECGENFGGLIYFDTSKSAWREDLKKILVEK